MTKINLLPWRETHRKEKNKDFYIKLAMFAALGIVIVFAHYMYMDDRLKFQNKRNAKLDNEILALQTELEEIRLLEETKQTVPDGVFLTALKQEGQDSLMIEGHAESNARVSALMRKMANSEYFKNPVLTVIAADKDLGYSTFKLSITQSAPEHDQDEDNGI